ncbi:amino acid/polyamine transporter I [Lipomyces tetrasporus]|uniref:Amino acid/polyamine transporter I n=1 Tax=Lipomyces tetrasporus TaxID=54092 RepID=A0AAD7QS66_9ASCO|nr:amino acid/polyamine transporter I [Lipomyces tetrasporus]KAJ8098807.1 amino acid/polyamine transporter I [Lipomyces tetrasporus]
MSTDKVCSAAVTDNANARQDVASTLVVDPLYASDLDLDIDERQLRANGHVGELPRRFGFLSLLGLGFNITNSWIGLAASITINLTDGGRPAVVWGCVIAFFVCGVITLGLAELASAYPSAGGQYHMAFMVASPNTRAFAAYIVGWMALVGWWITHASGCIFIALNLVAFASFYHPSYEPARWHVWMLYTAVHVICVTVNLAFPKLLPAFNKFALYLTIVAFVASIITVGVTGSSTQVPASDVFAGFSNASGWSSTGLAFLIATANSMYTFIAVDAATHIAEEVPQPSLNVPKAMVWTIVIGGITAIPFAIVLMLSMTDLDGALGTSTGLPSYEIYIQALKNSTGATILQAAITILYMNAVVSLVTTWSRLSYALARDNGLPFSRVFARIHKGTSQPLNSIILGTVLVVIYGLLYIASSVAFNSIIGSCIMFLNITYVIPQAIVAYRGREKVLPPRFFRLPRYIGYFINWLSTIWVIFVSVLFCLPSAMPVVGSPASMNYTSVVFVGVLALVLLLWVFDKRKKFVGPDVKEGLLREANLAEVELMRSRDIAKAQKRR